MGQPKKHANNNKKRQSKQKGKALENALMEIQVMKSVQAEQKKALIPSPINTPGFNYDGAL